MPSSSRPEGAKSPAPQTIPGSLTEDGSARRISNQEIHSSIRPKLCEWCREPFVKKSATAHRKARFCGRSCSAKWRMGRPEYVAKLHTPEIAAKRGERRAAYLKSGTPEALQELERIRTLNPMARPEVREKVSRRLKAMNHQPSVRGGNGRGLTEPQRMMKEILGEPWQAELSVSLGRSTPGYPTHYKLDLGNAEMRVGIELDGNSHRSRKAQDQKKDEKLASLGWTVLRFWNREILDWIGSGMLTDSSVSTILASKGILPSR